MSSRTARGRVGRFRIPPTEAERGRGSLAIYPGMKPTTTSGGSCPPPPPPPSGSVPVVAGSAVSTAVPPSSTFTLSLPAGVVAGEMLLASVTTEWSNVTVPAGWTLVRTVNGVSKQKVFSKVATGSEPASIPVTLDDTGEQTVGVVLRVQGTAGVDVHVGTSGESTTARVVDERRSRSSAASRRLLWRDRLAVGACRSQGSCHPASASPGPPATSPAECAAGGGGGDWRAGLTAGEPVGSAMTVPRWTLVRTVEWCRTQKVFSKGDSVRSASIPVTLDERANRLVCCVRWCRAPMVLMSLSGRVVKAPRRLVR